MKILYGVIILLAVVLGVFAPHALYVAPSAGTHSNLCFKQVIEHNDHYPMMGWYPNMTQYNFTVSMDIQVLEPVSC